MNPHQEGPEPFTPAGQPAPARTLESMATHQIGEDLQMVKARLRELQSALRQTSRDCAVTADRYIHQETWKAIGWAAGLGFLVGLLLRKD